MKETIENIAENTFKRRKTDVTDTKQEMKIVNYIKENLIIKSNEVPDRRQEVSQSIDLLTVKNYDSSSADDITILDNPDDNNFIENSNDNIGNGKVFNTVTKIGNPKIECITTRRPINQHHNSKENTKNVQKLEEPKQNDNGEQNTKNMLKSDEPKTKDEITQLENKYADNTFNPDDTPQIVDEISGGTSTILSLTSKSVVHRNGDLLNILSKSFMNIKQMQNQENMPSERHVDGNIKKAIVENATNAVNKVTSTNICKEMEGIYSGQTNKQDNKDSTNKTKERHVKRSHESEEENHEKRHRNTNDATEATKDATTVECVEKEQSQMAKNVNENKSKMQEVKGKDGYTKDKADISIGKLT
uniref:Uncharacterized protein n=1 Tax=Cacopsylla melanoneura TaxID=428564 RepID=A0A8D9F9G4_9HEMI